MDNAPTIALITGLVGGLHSTLHVLDQVVSNSQRDLSAESLDRISTNSSSFWDGLLELKNCLRTKYMVARPDELKGLVSLLQTIDSSLEHVKDGMQKIQKPGWFSRQPSGTLSGRGAEDTTSSILIAKHLIFMIRSLVDRSQGANKLQETTK